MAIGDSFMRVESFSDNELDEENQYLAKVTIVDPADYVITANEHGTLTYKEKLGACSGGPKYRLEPEGDLFRVVALRAFISWSQEVQPGEFGGLVEGEHNLSQEGNCWIADNSTVTGRSRVQQDARVAGDSVLINEVTVSGRALVISCTLEGWISVGGDAAVLYTVIEATKGSKFSVRGESKLEHSKVDVARGGGLVMYGGCARDAALRSRFDIVSVHTPWGWLSAFRDMSGALKVQVGCQHLGDFDQLREQARRHGVSDTEMAMLGGFEAMVTEMCKKWEPQGHSVEGDK